MCFVTPRMRLERALRAHAPGTSQAPPSLRAALADALGRPGHLMRATLVLASAEAAGLSAASGEQLACAIEYWHLASLLIDDLPCMDDAADRRGRRAHHRVHGESSTILTALALINRAYVLVGEVFANQPASVRGQARALVNTALGPDGIVGGQAADLAFASAPRTAGAVSRIAWRKTGMFLWLSLALPALTTQPGQTRLRELRRLAVYWGLAYQGADDLGDVLARSVQAGKTTQRDSTLDRPNLALELGVPAARRRVARLLEQARGTIARLEADDPNRRVLRQWHDQVFGASEAAHRAA